jgi:ATP-dependent helicase/nuclease subunit A
MNDVEQAAQLLLGQSALSGWVQERLDARIAHLLIDEFQDTNPLQWQALYGWLSAYVGARQQRAARVHRGRPQAEHLPLPPRRAAGVHRRQEVRARRPGRRAAQLRPHAPQRARRGRAGQPAMLAAQDAGEFDGYRAHTTERGDEGELLKLPAIDRDALGDAEAAPADDGMLHWRDSLVTPRVLPEEQLLQKECEQAAQWVAQRIADGTPPRQIMVLARRRSRLSAMQDALRQRHIPVQQPEKNELYDAPEVQDVVALIDALVSPAHDLSLARALKSPVFGVDDEALVQLALRQRERGMVSWFALIQKDESLPPVLIEAGVKLKKWQRWLMTLPPHDALDAIFHDGDLLAKFGAAVPATMRQGALANLRGVLTASLDIDGARFVTPYALVRALRAGGVRAPTVAAPDAVQLLTVHGAKGLEADTVLMLDCDAAPPRAQTMGVLVEWKGSDSAPTRFVFLASEKAPPACAASLLEEEQRARHREELNGLYVATTRARERLVLSSVRRRAPTKAAGGAGWSRCASPPRPASRSSSCRPRPVQRASR